MTIQQFDLVKLEAIIAIQQDLENTVEAFSITAENASALAIAANEAAEAAASASGNILFYDTKTAANSALSGLSEGQIVEIMVDESVSGLRTRYRKTSGVYVFKIIIGEAKISTVAALRAIPYSAMLTTAQTLGAGIAGDGGGGLWRWDAASTADDNTGTVIKPTGHSSAGRWLRVYDSTLQVVWFGTVGNGAADDTDAITAAITEASAISKPLVFSSGTYKVTSEIDLGDLEGVDLLGVAGKTTITAGFGYSIFSFDSLKNLTIAGISFENTYVNAALGGSGGILVGYTCDNVHITNCTFTVPTANSHAILIIASDAYSRVGYINGLWIQDCRFVDIGQSAITLMNRFVDGDEFTKAQNIHVTGNYAKNMGINNSYGMFISLDGYGSSWEVSDNTIQDVYTQAIEVAAWEYGEIRNNCFSASAGHTKKWRPYAFTLGNAKHVSILNNKCLTPYNVAVYFNNSSYIRSSGNVLRKDYNTWTTQAPGTVDLYNCNNCVFDGDIIITNAKYGIRALIESSSNPPSLSCSNNKFVNCTIDLSESSVTGNVGLVFDSTDITLSPATEPVEYNEYTGVILPGLNGTKWQNVGAKAILNTVNKDGGSWTPVLSCAIPGDLSASPGIASGKWYKDGNLITLNFVLEYPAGQLTHSTASGFARITGFPDFGNFIRDFYSGSLALSNITKSGYTDFVFRCVYNQKYIQIGASGSTKAFDMVTIANIPSGSAITISGTLVYAIQ